MMTEQEVVQFMESSETEQEWYENCRLVNVVNGGDYPDFWFRAINQSGMLDRLSKNW